VSTLGFSIFGLSDAVLSISRNAGNASADSLSSAKPDRHRRPVVSPQRWLRDVGDERIGAR